MTAPTCKWCGRQVVKSHEFCCGNCEVQWHIHEEHKDKPGKCPCDKCRTIYVIGGKRE
jgi:hypothetical protein